MSDDVIPFRVDVPEASLADLRERLRRTRWPEPETVTDWSQGTPLPYVRELCQYWLMEYEWPAAQARLGEARVRLRALHGLLSDTVGRIEEILAAGDRVARPVRADARLAAAHIVRESRAVIGGLLEASGAGAHFLDNPLQRAKRDVDVMSGHVIFDYDVSRELAGALAIGLKVAPFAMV